jgi:tetratricopeptide (TPR) repeat protein
LEALGKDEAAVENYLKAVHLNEERKSNFASPYVNLTSYYNRTGQPELALQYSRKAIQVNPKSDSAYFQMAKTHRYLEEWSQAAQALENAIAINSHSSQYYYLLGTAYRHLGKHDESRAAMETFKKLESESAEFERKRREARRREQAEPAALISDRDREDNGR